MGRNKFGLHGLGFPNVVGPVEIETPYYVDRVTIVDRLGALLCEVFTNDEYIPKIALKNHSNVLSLEIFC